MATTEVVALREALLDDIETERVGLDRLDGRVLATPVTAQRDVPSHAQATMDGFALAAADDPPRALTEATTGPGDDPPDHRPGTATQVATGGPLPRGSDAVLPVEAAEVQNGVLVTTDVPEGQHVMARGSIVTTGESVLAAGRRLAPRDAAVLRELERETVSVHRRFSTAILATGTEIDEGREPDRNSVSLANLVRSWGGDPTLAGSVPDDPDRVGDRIDALADDHDVILTTGGTGVSDTDETSDVLRDRTEVRVSGVAMLPGSNTTVASLDNESVVVASLPGPPGAAFACATLLVRPLFVGSAPHPTITTTMACPLSVPDRDIEFVIPVEFLADSRTALGVEIVDCQAANHETEPSVVPLGHPSSSISLYDERYRPHRVASCARLSAADGFVLTRDDLVADEQVTVVPYEAVES